MNPTKDGQTELPAGLTIKGRRPKVVPSLGRAAVIDASDEWYQLRADGGWEHQSLGPSGDPIRWFYSESPEDAAEFIYLHADLPEGWEIVKLETQWMVRKSPNAAGPLYSTAREAYNAALAAARPAEEPPEAARTEREASYGDREFCCKARPTADPTQECDFPFCGCSRTADEAVNACIECGWLNAGEAAELKAKLTAAEAEVVRLRDALAGIAEGTQDATWCILQARNALTATPAESEATHD